jgi:hypothetical protein
VPTCLPTDPYTFASNGQLGVTWSQRFSVNNGTTDVVVVGAVDLLLQAVSVLLESFDSLQSLYDSSGGGDDDGQHSLFVLDRSGYAVFSSDLVVTQKDVFGNTIRLPVLSMASLVSVRAYQGLEQLLGPVGGWGREDGVYIGLDDPMGPLLVSVLPITDATGMDLVFVLVYSLKAKADLDTAMQVGKERRQPAHTRRPPCPLLMPPYSMPFLMPPLLLHPDDGQVVFLVFAVSLLMALYTVNSALMLRDLFGPGNAKDNDEANTDEPEEEHEAVKDGEDGDDEDDDDQLGHLKEVTRRLQAVVVGHMTGGRRVASEEARQVTAVDRAVEYLHLHARGANLLDVLRLEYGAGGKGKGEVAEGGPGAAAADDVGDDGGAMHRAVTGAESRLHVLRLTNSLWYEAVVAGVIATHMALAFWEAPVWLGQPDLITPTYAADVLVVAGVCIALELADSALLFYALGARVYTTTGGGVHKCRVQRKPDTRRCLLLLLLLVFVSDWCVSASGHYYHRLTKGGGFHLLLPFTAPLRPVLFVLRFKSIARYMRDLGVTILRSKTVLLMVLVGVLLSATWNTVFFAGSADVGLLQGRAFDDIFSSYFQTFVFIITQLNYGSIAYGYSICPAALENTLVTQNSIGTCPRGAFFAYFIFLAFMGSIVLVSLIIQEFGTFYSQRITKNADAARVQACLASLVAFAVLDQDGSGGLDQEELAAFFGRLSGGSGAGLRVVLQVAPGCEAMGDGVDTMTFTELMDEIWFNGKSRAWTQGGGGGGGRQGEASSEWGQALLRLKARAEPALRGLRRVVFAKRVQPYVLMTQFLCAMLYGYPLDCATLDAVTVTATVYWAAE